MRAVVQRVSQAGVAVDERVVGAIQHGLLVYVGVGGDDAESDAVWLAEKIATLRIFTDAEGKMNLSVTDVGGAVLLISAFALQGDARKGRRPSFAAAAEPGIADGLYRRLGELLEAGGLRVERGVFRAHMAVSSVNDGPVTILLDSRRVF